MSNNILEQEKEVTIRIPVKDYLFAANLGKYLYMNNVNPGPNIEDFVKTAFYFYVNSMNAHLGQKAIDYPARQQHHDHALPQEDTEGILQGRYQPVPQPQPEPVQQTLFTEEETKDELDLTIDEMFDQTMASTVEQELARIRRFSGSGQNVTNKQRGAQ